MAFSREETAYHELSAYTLLHGDPAFIHQHVVDAWAAQSAAPGDKPVRLTMALVGLFLHVERGFTGREAQTAHMQIAKRRQTWPAWLVPDDRGPIRATDVMAAAAGPERDRAVHAWATSVWQAFACNREAVIALLTKNEIL